MRYLAFGALVIFLLAFGLYVVAIAIMAIGGAVARKLR